MVAFEAVPLSGFLFPPPSHEAEAEQPRSLSIFPVVEPLADGRMADLQRIEVAGPRSDYLLGAETRASPSTTGSPTWFSHQVRRTTHFLSSFNSVISTLAVMVSPK